MHTKYRTTSGLPLGWLAALLLAAMAIGLLAFISGDGISAQSATVIYVDDDAAADGDGSQEKPYTTIQAAIDAAPAGATIYIYPGEYSETTSSRHIVIPGQYTFGLYIGDSTTDGGADQGGKDGITLQGVDASGSPITDAASVAATITTNAENAFGPSGIFVQANDVAIAGLEIGDNYKTGVLTTNKTIEVIGDGFTLRDSVVSTQDGSVYINDFRYDDGSDTAYVERYTIEDNIFDMVTLDIASGSGATGDASLRIISGNAFQGIQAATRAAISFSSDGTEVPWYVFPVGGAVITDNTFSGNAGPQIRLRGNDDGTFDWASYWSDNTFDRAVVATADGTLAGISPFSYEAGGYTFDPVRQIGSSIATEVGHAQAGDTVLVGAGAYAEGQIVIDKSLTLQGAGQDATVVVATTNTTGAGGTTPAATNGWFYIAENVEANFSGLTLDGGSAAATPVKTYAALYYRGSGSVDGVTIRNVLHSRYLGFGVFVRYSTGPVRVSNSTFENIARVGAGYYGSDARGSVYDGNVWAGTDRTDAVEYGVEVGREATATITNSTFSGARAIALTDGSESAAILVTDFYGDGAGATITNNIISDSLNGIEVGYDNADASTVVVRHNSIAADVAISTTNPLVDAEENWWGSDAGPQHEALNPGGNPDVMVTGDVDFTPWLCSGIDTEPDTPGLQPTNELCPAPPAPGNDGAAIVDSSADNLADGEQVSLDAGGDTATAIYSGDGGAYVFIGAYNDNPADPSNPDAATDLFDTGTFFDIYVEIIDADPDATLTVTFTGSTPGNVLLYWDGDEWRQAVSNDGTAPLVADASGETTIVFGANSQPSLADLGETPFVLADLVFPQDLAVTKELRTVDARAGDTVRYDLTVTNNATEGEAANVVVTDRLPDETTVVEVDAPDGWTCTDTTTHITCETGTMQPGEEALIIVRLQLDDDLTGIVTNRASVTSQYSDPDTSNNEAEVSFEVVTGPDGPQPPVTPTEEPTETPTEEPSTYTYDLNFRWTFITWYGVDGTAPAAVLGGEDSILSIVTALFGWDGTNQQWLGFFPNAVDVPGANDLTSLQYGAAYWIAIGDGDGTTWTVVADDQFEE